jgi:hypothetical protein
VTYLNLTCDIRRRGRDAGCCAATRRLCRRPPVSRRGRDAGAVAQCKRRERQGGAREERRGQRRRAEAREPVFGG